MSRRRTATEEERALFEAALRDASVLQENSAKRTKKTAPQPEGKPKPPPPPRITGVDGKTAERLRKGTIEPDARLDLHGLTESTAHRALVTFLRGAAARGARLTLIITGKGARTGTSDEMLDPLPQGVLKSAVPRWLQEPEFARFVADVRSAHRRHGGSGALYVYLRKPANIR